MKHIYVWAKTHPKKQEAGQGHFLWRTTSVNLMFL